MKKIIISFAIALAALNLVAFMSYFGTKEHIGSANIETAIADSPVEIADAEPAETVWRVENDSLQPGQTTAEMTAEEVIVPATVQSTEPTITITGSGVNVRTGPGLDYDVIGSISMGERYNVVRRACSVNWVVWYKVMFDGSYGYVCSNFCHESGDMDSVPWEALTTETTASTETTTVSTETTTVSAETTTVSAETTTASTETTAVSTETTTAADITDNTSSATENEISASAPEIAAPSSDSTTAATETAEEAQTTTTTADETAPAAEK